MNLFHPTTPQLSMCALVREAAAHHYELYGTYPEVAWVSQGWMDQLASELGLVPTMVAVGGVICVVSMGLEGVSVMTRGTV